MKLKFARILFTILFLLHSINFDSIHGSQSMVEDEIDYEEDESNENDDQNEATTLSSTSALGENDGNINITDMVIKHGDIVEFWNGGDKSALENVARSAIRQDANNRWVKYTDSDGNYVVPYEISYRFEFVERQTIMRAMRDIEENTCIRYRRRENEATYLYIDAQPQGCWTTVGMCVAPNVGCTPTGQGGYRQFINLQNHGACTTHRTAIHELFHTLGLYHEHNRPDRDQFVTIHFAQIQPENRDQFRMVDPRNTDTYGARYDYGSAMHYRAHSFGIYGSKTITAKDPSYQSRMGNEGPSENDYKKICSVYSCSQCMGQTSTVVPSRPNPYLPPTGDDSDEDGPVTARCADCRPLSICSKVDASRFRYFYKMHCCGDCNKTWRRKWCRSLSESRRARWRAREMCD